MNRVRVRWLVAFAIALGFASTSGPARASDGVIEISHVGVVASGGYPFVIATSGSYILTSNLTVPSGVDGMVVTAPNVTIDLNGFTIGSGGGPPASGVDGLGAPNLTVRNGTITGFGGNAIEASLNATVSNTRLTGNSGGIFGADACRIVENVIQDNGGSAGIAADRCKIESNVIRNNGGTGISGRGNVIVFNTITNNPGGIGLVPGVHSSTIDRNVIDRNFGFGISDGATPVPPLPPPGPFPPPPGAGRVVITGNSISHTSSGAGIAVSIPSVISGNTISGNYLDGIICGASCVISANSIESNNAGSSGGGGGVTTYAGSSVNDNAINENYGYGLALPITAGYRNNTFNANGPGGPDVVPFALAHPTSGFFNLCSGQPGPVPFLCP